MSDAVLWLLVGVGVGIYFILLAIWDKKIRDKQNEEWRHGDE